MNAHLPAVSTSIKFYNQELECTLPSDAHERGERCNATQASARGNRKYAKSLQDIVAFYRVSKPLREPLQGATT